MVYTFTVKYRGAKKWTTVSAATTILVRKKWMKIVNEEYGNSVEDISGQIRSNGKLVGKMFANEMFGFGWAKPYSNEYLEVNRDGTVSKRKAWY